MNCASCGAALPERALFCGNCGRAVTAAATPRARIVDPRPGDTMVIRPTSRWVFPDLGADRSETRPSETDAAQDATDVPDASVPDAAATATSLPDAAPATTSEESAGPTSPTSDAPEDEHDAPDADLPAPLPASSVRARYEAGEASPAIDGMPTSRMSADRVPVDDARLHDLPPSEVPTAESPIVTSSQAAFVPPGAASPVPHVLSFSTGERVVVVGAGLLGRRPYPQPTERFDQLVSIADNERSVSKTHLEFGLEGGELWVCDRYSANGTVIIPPAGAPHRCEPGRRYRVPRGGRVEIGDHWFDVR